MVLDKNEFGISVFTRGCCVCLYSQLASYVYNPHCVVFVAGRKPGGETEQFPPPKFFQNVFSC